MILACQKITKAFGGDTILNDISFLINEGDKAALIGINGAGKTTLLKVITGEYEADGGEVVLQRGATMGYLSQVIDVTSRRTIYEEMLDAKKDIITMEQDIRELEKAISHLSGEELEKAMEKYSQLTDRFEKSNGYAWKSEIVGVLKGLGFTEAEFDTPIHTLSGGQKTRVALSRILLTRPDIILLDEPTNHLDMDAIRWLETFLGNYRGAVLIVSHDRYFLDRVVSKVIEIENGNSQTFLGNYSRYAEKKKAQRDAQMKQYLNQQQEIQHQEEVIAKLRSFNREKSIRRAESREKMLDKMELVDKPVVLNSRMRISLEPEIISGNDVLTIEHLSKSFDNKPLFKNLNLSIRRGEVVGLLGANGTGKTTLLKIINRHLRPDGGKIHYGAKVSIGYYDQEQHVLNDEKTIFDEISDAYPKLTNTRIRNVLAAFLFTGDRVFQKIGTLSGGEKGRVSLAKLMLSNANFLILDEPTNHLDIQSREILEDAINDYEGTVFYVSHDRYFINQTATRILDLSPEGIVNYKGNYTYYLEQKEAGNIEADSDSVLGSPETSGEDADKKTEPAVSSKEDWKRSREEAARQRKRANELKKTEADISRLEEENESIKEEMNSPDIASNVSRLMELSRKYEENEEALLELYDKWEELSEE
ncbi:MAG TPA: ABC-F family ATP-binding cassette domain-containing protein [Candidatus Anaerobutyricum stercoripullorum]|uniref:ABC-F family ATP-binding cassette domain-containing protein n=1 Tax=Candidatus Anaerobutyricum stercoripullorum TaxID=2838456 RepID=A0A9D2BDX0_9FIRM|nr:ABC-F family ATP-binding cassette domain-containing protein [Candidatus Anaerobutyricum stercoripullorum]